MSEQGNVGSPQTKSHPPQPKTRRSSRSEGLSAHPDHLTPSSSSSSDESSSHPSYSTPQEFKKRQSTTTYQLEPPTSSPPEAADASQSQTESWTTEEEDDTSVEEEETTPAPVTVPLLSATSRPQHQVKSKVKLLVERAIFRLHQNTRQDIPGRHPLRRQLDIFLLRMFVFMARYHRELCILFLLFASGLASLRSGPMKTRSTPTPKPFFTDTESLELLDDYYRGDYVHLVHTKIPKSPSFIFYYAPWDAESVAARQVFVSVAQYFNKTIPGQLRFYAVNCWWPQGECRKNYKNLSHFPIFVCHPSQNAGIIYSGPIRAELMIKFLNSLLKPITRIDNEEEMWRFRAKHDAIMLSWFNFTDSDSAQAYETYLQMSLRSLESDPFSQVGFGLFLNYELAKKFFLTTSNVISLVLFNEIHTAKWTGDRHTQGARGPVSQVANWIIERTKKNPITWAYQVRSGFANRPVALGPVDLRDELLKGPVILLVTRRYFPSSYSPFYALVKSVALDYFNCNNSGNVTKLRRTVHKLSSEWLTLWNSVARVCLSHSQGRNLSSTCAILTEQLKHWRSKKKSFVRESLGNFENISAGLNFTGLSCASERSFKFLAIDPIDMPYFHRLALGGLGYNDNTDPVLFLIDAPNEVILPIVSFNTSALAELIYEYTNEIQREDDSVGLLRSSRRFWIQQAATKLREVNHSAELHKISAAPSNATSSNLIRTMTSEDLLKYLIGAEPSGSLFLMYSAKFCGMCGISLTHFLHLSTFISENYQQGLNITFAKLDMYKNSLPEELTPDDLPTFVYFPSHNRSKSRVFEGHEIANTKNLLRFLLSEMEPENRVKLSLSSPACIRSQRCINENGSSNCTSASEIEGTWGRERENCLKANRLSVREKIQEILFEIQSGVHSAVEAGSSLTSGFSMDKGMSQDLEHLRSMKITLDVS